MRNEHEMLELILRIAREDERIRAVIMNGSRVNPNAPSDFFQDFDIIYLVTYVAPFRHNPAWIEQFGELMILQVPEDMGDSPVDEHARFAYLMQFSDGNRIDLTICPLERIDELQKDSLSLLLLDKDRVILPFAPPDESSYLPQPPTAKQFADCCNEFWWVCPYAAKGLWRETLPYARYMLDRIIRRQLMKMLTWYVGVKTQFQVNPGAHGKYLNKHLEPELWELLLQTYAGTGYEAAWDALFAMGQLFRLSAVVVEEHFGFEYPLGDDERVTAHLKHIRRLPKDAREMY